MKTTEPSTSKRPSRRPDPDWDRLGFSFQPTDFMYRVLGNSHEDPVWGEGRFLPLESVSLADLTRNEASMAVWIDTPRDAAGRGA